ncbi:ATP synthase subunit I [Pirellulaceae bacterium SH449]
MTWIEIGTLLFAGFAGLLLGGIFFGGLWWTVRYGVTAKQPGVWFLGSMMVRMTIVMAGFYFVGGGQWQRVLGCFIGFMVARPIVVWLTRPSHCIAHIKSTVVETGAEPLVLLQQESRHAT